MDEPASESKSNGNGNSSAGKLLGKIRKDLHNVFQINKINWSCEVKFRNHFFFQCKTLKFVNKRRLENQRKSTLAKYNMHLHRKRWKRSGQQWNVILYNKNSMFLRARTWSTLFHFVADAKCAITSPIARARNLHRMEELNYTLNEIPSGFFRWWTERFGPMPSSSVCFFFILILSLSRLSSMWQNNLNVNSQKYQIKTTTTTRKNEQKQRKRNMIVKLARLKQDGIDSSNSNSRKKNCTEC